MKCSRSRWRLPPIVAGILFGSFLFFTHQPNYEEQFIDLRLAPLPILRQPVDNFCGNLNFLVALHSSADDFSKRQLWRDTYGTMGEKNSFKILFTLGVYTGPNGTVQPGIDEEASKHGDILQSEFIDSYRNLTLKQIALLRYFHDNCGNDTILLKLDDDSAWNVRETAKYIGYFKRTNESSIICNVMRGSRIIRDSTSRWSISRYEYAAPHYIPYCSGMAYIINRPTVGKLLHALKISSFFWVDDAYVTGIVRQDAGVKLSLIKGISNPVLTSWKEEMKKFLFQHVPDDGVRTAFEIYNKQNISTSEL